MSYESARNDVIVNETGTTAAGATRYFPDEYGATIKGAVVFSLQINDSGGGTFTVEATMEENPQLTGVTWINITQAFEDLNTGLKSSSSAGNSILQCNGLNVERLRLKYVEPSSGTYDLHVHRRVI